MDANEFWCRAFLAAMTGAYGMTRWRADGAADYCEQGADAALAVAQRRGMVTGERAARPVTQADVAQAVGDYLARAQPELERVEVKATPDELKPGRWRVCVPNVGVFVMLPGDERVTRPDGAAIRIKWGETPPRPVEVWLERR